MGRTAAYLLTMALGAIPALAAFACLLPWRRGRMQKWGLSGSLRREAALALFWMFCGGMAAVTLTPRWVVWTLADLLHGCRWNVGEYPFFEWGTINLTPFQTLRFDSYILLGNVVLFIPPGLFTALLWRGFSWKKALLLGICAAGPIECWQLCIGRAFDIDDLLFNTLGVFFGFLLWKGLARLSPGLAERFHVHEKEETQCRP